MNIPQAILDKVKYLCREIPREEWSGVLFYSMEGSIREIEKVALTVQDILPMHKGSAGATEYDFGPSVIEYMMDHEEADAWKVGHIHSHNTMQTFFSGTDWSELEDNAPNHNFYLSLIVNNALDMTAKIVFLVHSEQDVQVNYTAKDEDGIGYTFKTEPVQTAQAKLVVYNCEIVLPQTELALEESFINKVKQIIKDAVKVITPSVPYGRAGVTPGGVNATRNFYQGPSKTARGSGWENTIIPSEDDDVYSERYSKFAHETSTQGSLTDRFAAEEDEEDDLADMLEEIDAGITDFTFAVLNPNNVVKIVPGVTELGDILKHYKAYKVSPHEVAQSIVKAYSTVYNIFYKDNTILENTDLFFYVLQSVIEELESETYILTKALKKFLRPTITGLELFQNNLRTRNTK